jgi:hypothetical protein
MKAGTLSLATSKLWVTLIASDFGKGTFLKALFRIGATRLSHFPRIQSRLKQ